MEGAAHGDVDLRLARMKQSVRGGRVRGEEEPLYSVHHIKLKMHCL